MIKKIEYSDVSAAVTNGVWTEIVLDQQNNLFMMDESTRTGVYLGDATKKRIDEIIFNLNQIKSVLP